MIGWKFDIMILFLTQRKQEHLPRFKQMLQTEFHKLLKVILRHVYAAAILFTFFDPIIVPNSLSEIPVKK